MQPNLAESSTTSSEPEHHTRGYAPVWTPRRIGIVAALWLIGAVVLAGMSIQAHRYSEFPGDVAIGEAIQQIHQAVTVRFINFASDANWPQPAGVIAIAVIVLLALFRHFRAALGAAVAGFGADGANVLLNALVARPRPNNVHIHAVAHLGLHSFPSGHVTHVTAFYGFLLYLSVGAMRRYPRWRLFLHAVQVVCVYFLIFIGPSRVLEGEHWPSDVLASYLLGALMLVVAIAMYHLLGVLVGRVRQGRTAPNVHHG
ncbi:MAG TPA: phosphatase PAP2 family protein [Ktedonobacterales bacterium]|jgi:undecaprenyl-diphosphatase|nr:phosphatase PAP2 family protein [Ktedonobacterales bacterium]